MTDHSPFSCPRCAERLFIGVSHDVAMHACGRCGGLWLDNEDSTTVVGALRSDVLWLADQASKRSDPAVGDSAEPLTCVECKKRLTRKEVVRARVEVDFCHEHGTWFDAGELRKVSMALATARAYAKKRAPRPLDLGPLPDFRSDPAQRLLSKLSDGVIPETGEYGPAVAAAGVFKIIATVLSVIGEADT